jgi:hypothetical protein
MSIEIFCCYARKDQVLLSELKAHLMPLQRRGLIKIWADTDIGAGIEWEREIEKHLDTAHLLLAKDPTDGFTNLWERKRLDLSVEALVLKPKFVPLFDEVERENARKRLAEYGYKAPWDNHK